MNLLKHPNLKYAKLIYEGTMFVLVVISLWYYATNQNHFLKLERAIWFIYAIDVFVRLYLAPDKLKFMKRNPLDFIALIPFDSYFLLARIARLIIMMRFLLISFRFFRTLYGILKTNGLNKVILVTLGMILLLAIPVQYLEPSINNYGDALWWSFVTITTVGYGDISPSTTGGRIIAILLMIFGIGLIGMITGSIATYFMSLAGSKKNPQIEFLKSELDRIDELSEKEIVGIIAMLEVYKKKTIQNEHHSNL